MKKNEMDKHIKIIGFNDIIVSVDYETDTFHDTIMILIDTDFWNDFNIETSIFNIVNDYLHNHIGCAFVINDITWVSNSPLHGMSLI